MLKHATTDEPGAASNPTDPAVSNVDAVVSSSGAAKSIQAGNSTTMKQHIDESKRNERFQRAFHLPSSECLLDEIRAIFWMMDTPEFGKYYGRLYLGDNYLCFQTYSDDDCSLILPYFAVRKLERISTASQVHAISISTCHQLKYCFQLGSDVDTIERVCATLTDRLRANIPLAKLTRPLMDTLATEALLDSRAVTYGGFGLTYGFPGDARKTKEKSKVKYWAAYFTENGRNLTVIRTQKFVRLVRIGLPNVLRGELWELCSGALWYVRIVCMVAGFKVIQTTPLLHSPGNGSRSPHTTLIFSRQTQENTRLAWKRLKRICVALYRSFPLFKPT